MKTDPEKLSGFGKSLKEVGPYLGIGVQLAATIVLMALIGNWLDKKFGQKFIFTLIFSLLGIFSGMYNLLKTLNYLEKRKKESDDAEK
ncbi:Hypothetical protein IALB_0766 [Ignavibacterium album JCM 16511]|uniref:F0F1-ATPase subunit n=1 Tax=Ignavibacterium album (strain DSM 19864 / JCM 16511 / NBRC 101810 / Mat9-16) TaxID=945713 RepID=I0AHM1_IGNAJ|nr:AtpZ/AtpI family protein [Ignavibacterium album]AFH48478.1 Hypothetical protein IALB_0766 [Ignavibacterium album JCM 16511]